ncbi:hypothetical protein QTP70_019980, partial [Hemibagrus guttatus]
MEEYIEEALVADFIRPSTLPVAYGFYFVEEKVWQTETLYRLQGSLCLSQVSLGIKAGYTLDGVPTHRRVHTHTTDNLEMPINLPRVSLDWGRKLEYPEETPEAQGEHANSTHGGGRNRTPQPW